MKDYSRCIILSVGAALAVADLAHVGTHVVVARSSQVVPHVVHGGPVLDSALLEAQCAAVWSCHGCP